MQTAFFVVNMKFVYKYFVHFFKCAYNPLQIHGLGLFIEFKRCEKINYSKKILKSLGFFFFYTFAFDVLSF